VGREVPVGEEERHKEKSIEQDVENKSPGNKSNGHNRMDNTFTFGLIWLV